MTASGDKPVRPTPEELRERLQVLLGELRDNLDKKTTRQIEELKAQIDGEITTIKDAIVKLLSGAQ